MNHRRAPTIPVPNPDDRLVGLIFGEQVSHKPQSPNPVILYELLSMLGYQGTIEGGCRGPFGSVV